MYCSTPSCLHIPLWPSLHTLRSHADQATEGGSPAATTGHNHCRTPGGPSNNTQPKTTCRLQKHVLDSSSPAPSPGLGALIPWPRGFCLETRDSPPRTRVTRVLAGGCAHGRALRHQRRIDAFFLPPAPHSPLTPHPARPHGQIAFTTYHYKAKPESRKNQSRRAMTSTERGKVDDNTLDLPKFREIISSRDIRETHV